jgi:outer membrane protein TolC
MPLTVPNSVSLRSAPKTSIVALSLSLLLSGCAAFSPDAGMSGVADVVANTIRKDVIAVRTVEDGERADVLVAQLLRRTLSVDSAVQIALLNNRGLQAAYNELALAEADAIEQSLPPNPTFSLSRITGGGGFEIERQVAGDILALATLPFRSEIARRRFHEAQLRAALETLRLAADVRRAYYQAVGSNELVVLLTETKTTAETIAQLSEKLGQTGGLNKLDQAREQVFYAEVTADLATARQQATSARERLARLLGVWDGQVDFKLSKALPSLPRSPKSLPNIEVEAIGRRVDLQMARIELDLLAKALNLTEATRFVTLLDLAGISRKTKEPEGTPFRQRGFDLLLQIPIFDGGEVRVRQAAESYNIAFNRLTEKAVNVRSEARDAYRAYRSTYDIAGHYQREVIPLRNIISDEAQLRYGSMQIDVFALLTEAKLRIAAQRASIDARRDFWLAHSDLQSAVDGGGRSENQPEGRTSTNSLASGG